MPSAAFRHLPDEVDNGHDQVPLRPELDVSRFAVAPRSAPSYDDLVREQLDRVLSSSQFVRSERLARLLRIIVESGLNGDVTGLKESVLGREGYDRGSDFDGRLGPSCGRR